MTALITLPFSSSNDLLPTDGADALDQIIARSDCLDWFQTDTAYCPLSSGKVTDIIGRKNTAHKFTQSNGALRAVLEARPEIGNWPALKFTEAERYTLTGMTPDFSAPYTMVAFSRFNSGAANSQVVLSSWTDTTHMSLYWYNFAAGGLIYEHGPGTSLVNMPGGNDNAWHLFIGSMNGTVLKGERDGTMYTDSSITNQPGVQTLTLGDLTPSASAGSKLNGYVADIGLFTGDAHADSTLINLIKTYIANVYGQSIAGFNA